MPDSNATLIAKSANVPLRSPDREPHFQNRAAQTPTAPQTPMESPPPTKSRSKRVTLGWRLIKDPKDPKGFRQVELTAQNLLHPQKGDKPLHHLWHVSVCSRLFLLLQVHCADLENALVLSDQEVQWKSERGHGPDIAFFLNAPPNFDAPTLKLAKTGALPQFFLEVLSKTTKAVKLNDLVHKYQEYLEECLRQYLILDRSRLKKGRRHLIIINYLLQDDKYVTGACNERGHVKLTGTPFYLGESEHGFGPRPYVGLFDATGKELSLSPELEKQLQEALGKLKAEIAAKTKAEERAAAAEKQVKTEAEAKTKAEERAAAAEKQAKTEAEAKTKAEERAAAAEKQAKKLLDALALAARKQQTVQDVLRQLNSVLPDSQEPS